MLSIIDWEKISIDERSAILKRPEIITIQNDVNYIINEVKSKGDEALLYLTNKFDKVSLTTLMYETQNAKVSTRAMKAMFAAMNTISTYHRAIIPLDTSINTANGIEISRIYRPIKAVGLYVPGGMQAPLISSLFMQAIPASIAGCSLRVLCTPPNEEGQVNPHILVAARLCGIDKVYAIGGAQAIAAMAYGTNTVPKVNKIFGPGNAYVTAAKQQVALDPSGAASDLPAGPSEVMILADDKANPEWVAADLLAQAEHGKDSQVILICESTNTAIAVNQSLQQQMNYLSRKDIVIAALQHGSIIICPDLSQQVTIVNQYAPEHLIINRKDAEDLVKYIESSGSIFVGQWAAETMGDYISGSNHVLPTYGYAKSHSGLSTVDFMKAISVQNITAQGIRELGVHASVLARLEGLDAHAIAVEKRLQELKEVIYE